MSYLKTRMVVVAACVAVTFAANTSKATKLTSCCTAKITVDVAFETFSDSLQLVLFGEDFLDVPTLQHEDIVQIVKPLKSNECYFEICITDGPQFFLIKENVGDFRERVLVSKNIIEIGDDVSISLKSGWIQFSGKGSDKMIDYHSFPERYSVLRDSISRTIVPPKFSNRELEYVYRNLKQADLISKVWIRDFGTNRDRYSGKVNELMLAEYVGHTYHPAVFMIGIKAIINNSFSPEELQLIQGYLEKHNPKLEEIVSEVALARSDAWINYVRQLISLKSDIIDADLIFKYEYIKHNTEGAFRDKLLTMYLARAFKSIPELNGVLEDAIATIQTPIYRKELLHILKYHSKNSLAKEFTLLDQNDNLVSLSDFIGKVVFIDFWFIGCIPCIHYYDTTVSLAEETFKYNQDVVFISVCISRNKYKWIEAVQDGKYTSLGVINLFTGDLGWEHPIVKDYGIISAPKPVLIDRKGYIYSMNSEELGRADKSILIRTINECLEK